ncbi:hypothetical protein HUT18_26405 [Streptomyces sp. NA04227]|uniref:hypothetical protein n=1 Tax=Streptomyces sp. NA04227 TaxID=2742136 RepID=UPI00158FF3D5|nr:hypothetical protein [Streptomyces sp. NA04227]QKW09395.1 hypothetical protein HUT18_26405 [Streptomyces sp. NA04227]
MASRPHAADAADNPASGEARPDVRLRPRAMRAPALDIVRSSALSAEDGALVLTGRNGDRQSFVVGGSGIARMRYFPSGGGEKTDAARALNRWGTVVFEDAQGLPVVQAPLTDWLPEADSLGTAYEDEADPLARAGFPELARALGVPLDTSESTWQAQPETYRQHRSVRAVHHTLPPTLHRVRMLAGVAWVAAFLTGVLAKDLTGPAFVVAGAALLLFVVSGAAVHAVLRRRVRDVVPNGPGDPVRPSPVEDRTVTRRFLRVPFVKVLPGELVLVDSFGAERRLPRAGSTAVKSLVVVDDARGEPLGVEFHGAGGQVRAQLPWRWWFAGPGGAQSWQRLVTSLAVPVRHRKAPSGANEKTWFTGQPLGGDILRMSPPEPRAARQETQEASHLSGGFETIVLTLFSIPLIIGFAGDDPARFVAALLAVPAVVLLLAPALTHQLTSRFGLDTEATPRQETP